jgi:hypothetical protein
MRMRTRAKRALHRALFRGPGLSRVHIVGCARSGTTMLHYAFLAFRGTWLHDRETSLRNTPTGRESLHLLRMRARRPPAFYVTKRNYDWWRDASVERLIALAIEQRAQVIEIVRDPRDVLTSVHARAGTGYYVSTDMWRRSVAAGERVMQALKPHGLALRLRYEDVVAEPLETQGEVTSRLGLSLRDGVTSWAALADNMGRARSLGRMAAYMHKLRNFDPDSIGRWARDDAKRRHLDEALAGPAGPALEAFMARHGY